MSVCTLAPLNEASLYPGFCVGEIPVDVDQVRSITAIGPTDFVALNRGSDSVIVGEDLDNDGIPESIRTLVTQEGLNHGLALSSSHLYASRSTDVYRWPYDPITKTVPPNTTPETVITNISADGQGGAPFGHSTRTLVFDEASNILYVSVGSNANVDPDSFRSRIRRFSLADESVFPIDFTTGEVFADGLRNEVGMEFDKNGVLWGVGNSADTLIRADLGGVIFNDNPAEEVHRFDLPGRNYGYPYCWREYNLPVTGLGRGTAWAWPSFLLSGVVTDDMCRTDYDQPVLAMHAHSAPLGITFYNYQETRPEQCNGVIPFPPEVDGWAFIAFHGSWNRVVPTGYKVIMVPINENGQVIDGIDASPIDLLRHEGDLAKWGDGFRPVDVSFDDCGRLLLSSDGTRDLIGGGVSFYGSKIVRIEATQETLADPPSSGGGIFSFIQIPSLLRYMYAWLRSYLSNFFSSIF